jgi:hypothetical protein
MQVICCVCGLILKDNRVGDGVVSHGYCDECMKKFREDNGLPRECSEVRQ